MRMLQFLISECREKRQQAGMNNITPPETVQSYLTTKEVAALVRLDHSYFGKISRQGLGPRRIVIGRAVRFARSDVDAWMQSQLEGAAA